MTDDDLLDQVARYEGYLEPNCGGVTISGGEPLMQPDFVSSVFKKVHNRGLTTCLDTACYGMENDWKKVLAHTDYVMLCLKGMDNGIASKVAGVPAHKMARSKDFALFIRDNFPDIKLSLRWVLMEGITDTLDELEKLINFSKQLSPVFTHIELIAYHELGKSKWEALGIAYPLEDMIPFPRVKAERVKEQLENAGVKTVLSMI
jgi:pyruvate formate lyase activating enzyme